ncbi:hypothetical protein ACVIU7_008238 [Bradyrhizobium liaoningense]
MTAISPVYFHPYRDFVPKMVTLEFQFTSTTVA